MARSIEMRLAALEASNAPAVVPLPLHYWSNEHDCMMQDHGGFILPVPGTEPVEWEARAVKQQAALIAGSK